MFNGEWVYIIQDYGMYSAGATAVLSFIILAYKKGVKPVIKHFKNWYDMSEKIDHIFFEITPNGGTSIKDKVDRIDSELHLANERQRALLADSEFAHFEMDAEGNYVWVNRTYTD